MRDPVRVLVYGGLGAGACDYYRLGMFVGGLAALGVDVEGWTPDLRYPSRYGGAWYEAIRDGQASLDLDALARADVLVFSRWRNTMPACTECGADCGTPEAMAAHAQCAGHETLAVDPLIMPLLVSLLGDARLRLRTAVVYDLDDDLFHQPAWVGHAAGLARHLELVELLARTADLVTVSTPVLADVLGRYSPRVLVVRNAVETTLYEPPGGGRRDGDVRLLFYGAPVRLRDYELCRGGVEALVRERPSVRRMWLGGSSKEILAAVEKAYPYVPAGAAFAERLMAIAPDVGLAPIEDSQFGRAKSELHWLEYSAAGAVTVASRCRPDGPYDVVHDGADGFLVETPDEWRSTLLRLAAERALREDVAGRARERVFAEYDAASRAPEWAAAYAWAAEHRGIGGIAV